MFASGKGGNGRLAQPDFKDKLSPTLVLGLLGHHIVAASAGHSRSIFLSKAGELFSTVYIPDADVKAGATPAPLKKLPFPSPVTSIDSGPFHNLAVCFNGGFLL